MSMFIDYYIKMSSYQGKKEPIDFISPFTGDSSIGKKIIMSFFFYIKIPYVLLINHC